MKTSSRLIKYSVLTVLLISIFFISVGRCQDEDEDDEDTYDEDIGDESTTTTRSRTSRATTISPPSASGRNDSQTNESSTVRAGVEATTRTSVQTPASAPSPRTTRATVRTTTISEYEDDEVTTEEEGYGYVFRPLNNLIDNIVAGNVTGIVDHALSIRTPPEIRAFVNNVMSNVFGAGIGTALKQFMPNLFSTKAPSTVGSTARDPIPGSQTVVQQSIPQIQAAIQQPIPQVPIVVQDQIPQVQAVITARNSSDEVKSAKTQQPVQLSFAHPGAPASRLRCEVIS